MKEKIDEYKILLHDQWNKRQEYNTEKQGEFKKYLERELERINENIANVESEILRLIRLECFHEKCPNCKNEINVRNKQCAYCGNELIKIYK